MAVPLEKWDDGDIQGDFVTTALHTANTALSSRQSIHSESNFGDEDWQVPLTPNDEASASRAISTAQKAGIPIPHNVPPSALLAGSIKRLGTKKSRQDMADDWADDLDIAPQADGPLQLKLKPATPGTAADGLDEFDDWADGSLGIRNAGTRRDVRNRSSSVSAMSPSIASVRTFESEEDGLDGLIIPSGHLNFETALKKRPIDFDTHQKPSTTAHSSTAVASVAPKPPQTPVQAQEAAKEDFFAGIDLGNGDAFDTSKRTINRNIKRKLNTTKPTTPASRAQTTLTFTDKPGSTKIPRPVSSARPSRLEPLLETGHTHLSHARRPEPTTTGAQLLRSKRSMPVLRHAHAPSASSLRSPPAGPSFSGSPAMSTQPRALTTKKSAQKLRRDSDPHRPMSPQHRPPSRLSTAQVPETPTRQQRRDMAPVSLAREAAARKTITRPARRRHFGDGTELEIFDDLPTSAAKESRFTKQPSTRAPPRTLRNQASLSKLPSREKTATPLPAFASKGHVGSENLPHFARDTAASRIAREQKLGSVRPRGDGPLMPIRQINWQAQVAARSPHASPTAQRLQRKGPTLIHPMNYEQRQRTEKEMTWNPTLCRWEGNENALAAFDPPPAAPPSPPRPALITHMTGAQGVQVVGGMVFDPRRMCWLKMGRRASDARAPSMGDAPLADDDDDDDDPFKGIDDLQDTPAVGPTAAATAGPGPPTTTTSTSFGTRAAPVASEWLVGEEFDLGPEFIRRQREEEVAWRARIGAWFTRGSDGFGEAIIHADESWKWAIRELATTL